MAPENAGGRRSKQVSCLLSEFSQIQIRSWFWPAWRVFGYFSLAGVLTVFLAILGKADGLALKFTAKLDYGAATSLETSACTIYGYVSEVNHGITYILIAPLFVALAVQFARSGGEAFSKAEKSRNIIRTDEKDPDRSRRDRNEPELGQAAMDIVAPQNPDRPGVTKWISNVNRKLFTLLFFVLLAALVLKNFAFEISGYQAAMARAKPEWDDVGHVQAPLIADIKKRFDAVRSVKEKVNFLAGRPELLSRLEKNLAQQVVNVDSFIKAVPNSHDAVVLDHGKLVRINLQNDAIQKNLLLDVQTFGGPDPRNGFQMIFFYLFAAFAFTLEGVFQAVAVWTLLKVLVYISFLWTLAKHMDAPKSGRVRYKLSLEFYDAKSAYGLGMFHFPYNLIVALIALGILLLNLIRANTSAPNLMPVRPGQWGLNTIFALSMAGVALVIGVLALCLGPIGFFGLRFADKRNSVLEPLYGKLNRIPLADTAARDAVKEEINLVKSQSAWPRNDRGFRIIVAIAIGFLGLAPLLEEIPGIKDAAASADLPKQLKHFARSSCYLLHLDIAKGCPPDEVEVPSTN